MQRHLPTRTRRTRRWLRSDYVSGAPCGRPFFCSMPRPPLGGGRRAGISSLSIGILARAQALQFRCQLARLCFLSAKATLDLRPASNFHPGTNQPIVHFSSLLHALIGGTYAAIARCRPCSHLPHPAHYRTPPLPIAESLTCPNCRNSIRQDKPFRSQTVA